MTLRSFGLAAFLAVASAVPAVAQMQPMVPLQPRGWYDLAPEEQRRAWENYQRFQRIPERQRGMIERRYRAFQALPPEERQRLRQNYDRWRTLDPDQRQRFGLQYRRWKDEGGRAR